ncbi:hypothetical protein LTR85_011118 [Meristemomyces frigidus]|nr:hypothetical protein LTR85_011118 [Meristemomyces frigidus]
MLDSIDMSPRPGPPARSAPTDNEIINPPPITSSDTAIENEVSNGLRNLRYDDGDVVIKLGKTKEHLLLVHSDVLRQWMPTLAPSLKPEWSVYSSPELTKHPNTGSDVKVHTLALKYVDNTFLLEGQEVIDSGDWHAGDHFHMSTLASDGWPERRIWIIFDDTAKIKCAGQAHSILTATAHGHPITMAALGDHQHEEYGAPRFNHDVIDTVSCICAYAEYYGCLSRVVPLILELLFEQSGFWKAVSKEAVHYMRLGIKLRSPVLYFDAYRHLVATYWHGGACEELIARELDISVDEVHDRFGPMIAQLKNTCQTLEHALLRLQLTEHRVIYSCAPVVVHTSFLNALRFMLKDRSEYVKARERFDYIARSVYGQWLVQQLYGEYIYSSTWGKDKGARAGGFNLGCYKIVHAAVSDSPSELFGFKAAGRMSSIFRLGSKHRSEKYVTQELVALV